MFVLVTTSLISWSFAATAGASPGEGGDPSATAGARKVRLGEVNVAGALPDDLTRPEGRSRWDLTGLGWKRLVTRTLQESAAGNTVTEETAASVTRREYRATYGGDDASRWLFPDRYRAELRPGTKRTLLIDESIPAAEDLPNGEVSSGETADRLRIDTEITGIGWLHLPSGPREVVLERALVSAARGGAHGFAIEALIHRWIDPLAGVVAEVSGRPSPGGVARTTTESAFTLDATISSAATLKIHVSENSDPVLTTLFYGWGRPANTPISALDPNGYANAGALVAANTWNFSGNNTGAEWGATTTPITSGETCNFAQCGYNRPGAVLERSDKNFSDPNTLYKVNDVAETEVRAGDVTIWLRAGAQNEGVPGATTGENRFCYTTVGTTTRTPVPLWRFSHQDSPGGEYYYQAGDSWSGGPFNCEQNIFQSVCGGSGTNLLIKAFGTHTGTQHSEVVKGGVVTVPSGHTFNSLLVRTTADFSVFLGSCSSSLFKVQDVNTINYLWQVPHLGTVARIQSPVNAADANSFTTVDETNFQFGLFPPRSITITGVTDTTVSLSWDPGLDTHRINGYKIYWDTDSGSSSAYAFNSIANPGQVSIVGTTATISGLTPGTSYFVTVTSRSNFTDPSTGVMTTYESLRYPTQIAGDPNFIYPIEVLGATTCGICVPTQEVTGVTETHSGSDVLICWSAVSDPYLIGYRVLGSNSKQSDAGYAPVADVGLETCYTGSPSQLYYLVVARGQGGTGPWGHYGH